MDYATLKLITTGTLHASLNHTPGVVRSQPFKGKITSTRKSFPTLYDFGCSIYDFPVNKATTSLHFWGSLNPKPLQ